MQMFSTCENISILTHSRAIALSLNIMHDIFNSRDTLKRTDGLNTTGATSGAGTANPSGAPEFTLDF